MAYTSGNDIWEAVSAYLEGGPADLSEDEIEILLAFSHGAIAKVAAFRAGETDDDGEQDA